MSPSMRLSSVPRAPLSALTGLVLVVSGATGCAPESPAEEGAPEPIAEAIDAITGTTVVSRGEQWVNAKLHYCQAAYEKYDGDTSCWAWEGPAHLCDRQSDAAWNAYRSDCSGFITWAWGLPAVGSGGYVTSNFAPFQTGFSHAIQASDLEPGDAANKTVDGHIVLFKAWKTKGTEAVFMEEPGCSAAEPYAHEFTSTVTLNGTQLHIAYEGETFTAIRFDGLTNAPPPAWGASFVAQSFPLASKTMTMTVNQVLPASITLKNTGTKAWDSKTKIGTTVPRDRNSPFAGADWLAPNRLAGLPPGATVAPGQTHKFTFSFYAPPKPGLHDEHFGVVEEGVAWFGDPNEGGPADGVLEVKIDVQEAQYHGAFVAQSFPTLAQAPIAMTVGQTLAGTITLKNVGTAVWKAGVTKLAPTPRDKPSPLGGAGWLSATRVSSPPADVPPGGSYAFPVELTASAPGNTTQRFSLVEEGVTWFADAPKGGGPPDDLLAIHVVVTEAPPGAGGGGAGGGADNGGVGGAENGAGGAANGGGGAGGAGGAGGDAATGAGGGGGGATEPAASSPGGDGAAPQEVTGSCTFAAPGPLDGTLAGWLSVLGATCLAARRRRRGNAP